MITFYRPPILTVVFRLLGVLCLIASIVLGIILLRQGAALKAEGVGEGYGLMALSYVAGGIMAFLLYWGIAQVIDFLGKTAFYTEQMYVQGATKAGVKGKMAPAKAASDSYDDDDEEEEERKAPAPAAAPASAPEKEATPPPAGRTKFACKGCGQRISALTSEIGNRIACPNCGDDVIVS